MLNINLSDHFLSFVPTPSPPTPPIHFIPPPPSFLPPPFPLPPPQTFLPPLRQQFPSPPFPSTNSLVPRAVLPPPPSPPPSPLKLLSRQLFLPQNAHRAKGIHPFTSSLLLPIHLFPSLC